VLGASITTLSNEVERAAGMKDDVAQTTLNN
jgi:hypothetical protein